MPRKIVLAVVMAALLMVAPGTAVAVTVNFTAADIKAEMLQSGAPLNDATYQWGLWAIRAMPIVGGSGIYTITSGSTAQTGWGVTAPGIFGNVPFAPGNHVWFWDASGSEAGYPANPLYMIMDKPANTFTSYAFDPPGTFLGTCTSPGDTGCNYVTAVDDTKVFSFDFTLGVGATWDNNWRFVVDGSKYTLGTLAVPGIWLENIFGGYGVGGGLANNMGGGYLVPEPSTGLLLVSGLAGLLAARRIRKR